MYTVGVQTRSAALKARNSMNEDPSKDTIRNRESLPNEIWKMILDRVERTNDLLACRKVNRTWHSITTPICRGRFLPVNLEQVVGLPDTILPSTSFYSTFKNCNILPWSACDLDLALYNFHSFGPPIQSQLRRFSAQFLKFIRLFGSQIRELTISGFGKEVNDAVLLSIMNGVPNVEYLDISGISIPQPIQESCTAQLGRLKGLIASFYGHQDLRFLEFLLNRPEIQLRSLQLTIDNITNCRLMESYDVLSTLIAGIPILHLVVERFSPALFVELTRKRVQIHQLKILLDGIPSSIVSNYYSPLEELLKSTADSLGKLTLQDQDPSTERVNSRLRLTIPTLPQLTYICLNDIPNVTQFTSDQFPRLAKVEFRISLRLERVTLFDLGPFHTVNELVMRGGYGDQQWNPFETDCDRIFPNLKELNVITFSDELAQILTKFKKLERLVVKVYSDWEGNQQLKEVSTLLSGGRQSGKDSEVGMRASQQGDSETASILSLTCLKTLKLELDSEQTMSDDFVDSYLLKIQPLDNLCLEGVDMSEEYDAKIRKYHGEVEIYNDRNPRKRYSPLPHKFDEMR